MKVAIQVKVRNGHLHEAAKQCGSQTALAEWIGVPPALLGLWLRYETPFWGVKTVKYDPVEVAIKLETITGVSIEEIFPDEVYGNREWLKKKKVVERLTEIPAEQLLALNTGCVPALAPSPDETILESEKRQAVNAALATLTHREQLVLAARFGLSDEEAQTLDAVATKFGVGRERIRQIEAKALRKLRHPSRSKPLSVFLSAERT